MKKGTANRNYIVIDLGTNNTRIFMKNHGIIFNEATLVAYDVKSQKIIGIGDGVLSLIGKSKNDIIIRYPLREGIVTDVKLVTEFVKEIFIASGFVDIFKNSYILMSFPPNVTKTEKDAFIKIANNFGAKYTETQDDIKLALIGMGFDIFDPIARLIVDLGAGKTTVGIVASNQTIISKSIKQGGNYINDEIMKFIKSYYDLSVGYVTVEEIKKTIGSLSQKDSEKDMIVFGRDVLTRLPKEVCVSGSKIHKILMYVYSQIGELVTEILGSVESDVIKDIISRGIILTGQGAFTKGIKEYFSNYLKVKVITNKTADLAIINGGEKFEEKLINNYNGIYNHLTINKNKTEQE